MLNKVIDYIKISIICTFFSLSLLITLGIIVFSHFYSEDTTNDKVINWMLKNVTIQTVIEEDKWMQEYPYDYSFMEIYKQKIENLKKSVNNFCTMSFPLSEEINNLVVVIKSKIYHYNIDEISSISESNSYVEEPVKNVLNFQSNLESLGYPFLYVQTPSPATIQYYNGEILDGDALKIAERSYSLTTRLKSEGVNVVNIPKDFRQTITFDSSSHWFPQDGLDCAREIAKELNKTYGFNIDVDIYSHSNFYDLMSEYEIARKHIEKNCGYNFVLPVLEILLVQCYMMPQSGT